MPFNEAEIDAFIGELKKAFGSEPVSAAAEIIMNASDTAEKRNRIDQLADMAIEPLLDVPHEKTLLALAKLIGLHTASLTHSADDLEGFEGPKLVWSIVILMSLASLAQPSTKEVH